MGTAASIAGGGGATGGLVEAMALPVPQLEIIGGGQGGAPSPGQLNLHDTVNVFVRDVDPAVYARNPELWLYRYKRTQGRGGVNNSHTSPRNPRKWVHPSHQNGAAKIGWSSGGGGRFDNAGLPLPGYDTEWALVAPWTRTNISVGSFFTLTGSDPVYAAPGSSAWAAPPGQGGTAGSPTHDRNRLKQFFHFAVTVEDSNDPTGRSRIAGPRSALLIVSQESGLTFDPTGVNAQRLKYYIDSAWALGQ